MARSSIGFAVVVRSGGVDGDLCGVASPFLDILSYTCDAFNTEYGVEFFPTIQ